MPWDSRRPVRPEHPLGQRRRARGTRPRSCTGDAARQLGGARPAVAGHGSARPGRARAASSSGRRSAAAGRPSRNAAALGVGAGLRPAARRTASRSCQVGPGRPRPRRAGRGRRTHAAAGPGPARRCGTPREDRCPSPTARRLSTNRQLARLRGPDWSGCATTEGLNSAAASTEYSWVNQAPTRARRASPTARRRPGPGGRSARSARRSTPARSRCRPA